ncbi:right-handed parallel beta-helix repeat-containing protein [Cytophagaceae bacterium ABcell3]|nr:right-handed parallel beta-helix repeat-containing protein [Cytophagaceae bacterium ABcell3]
MKIFTKIIFSVLLLLLFSPAFADIVFVNGSYEGGVQTGSSWDTPFTNIQDAIEAAQDGDEIWIAEGEYVIENSIRIDKHISFFGNFQGFEEDKELRDLSLHNTIISSEERSGIAFFSSQSDYDYHFNGFKFLNVSFSYHNAASANPSERINIYVAYCHLTEELAVTMPGRHFDVNTFIDECTLVEVYTDCNLQISNSSIYNSIRTGGGSGYSKFINNLIVFERSNNSWYIDSFDLTTFQDCTFQGESEHPSGIFSRRVDFINCLFQNLISESHIFYMGNVVDLSFKHNEFKDCSLEGFIVTPHQSGYPLKKANISNNIFLNNHFDGRIFLMASENISIENNLFRSNNSTDNSTVFDFPMGERLFIDHLEAQDNSGLQYLRIVSFDDIAVNNSIFNKNNTSRNSIPLMRFTASKGVIENCSFEENEGANIIAFEPSNTFKLVNCVFKDNRTRALISTNTTGTYAIERCKFVGNIGTSDSHAMLNMVGTYGIGVTISDSELANNQYKGESSALLRTTNLSINNSVITDNEIGNNSLVSGGQINVSNTLYANNFWNGGDGSLFSSGSRLELINSTLYNNKERNNLSTSLLDVSNAVIYNSCLWSNGSGILKLEDNDDFDIQFSNVQNGYPGEGNLDVNPRFIDPENGNFRLHCSSQLINAGSNEYAPSGTDLDGNQRILQDTVDIGAYEFSGNTLVANSTPDPQFNITDPELCIGQEIYFTNTTENKEYFSYQWNFGEGVSPVEDVHASFLFSEPGDYPVSLTATNACGHAVSYFDTISVNPGVRNRILHATSVLPGQTISYLAESQCDDFLWEVSGGHIVNGQGSSEIEVLWGDGKNGNGRVYLQATDCNQPGYCELPVDVEIPIFSTSFNLSGDSVVCRSSKGTYYSNLPDFVPGAYYTWSVEGGNISGSSEGYALDSILVDWGSGSEGQVNLSMYHEVLDTTVTASFPVQIRQDFGILESKVDFCVNSSSQILTNRSSHDFLWAVSGEGNQVEEESGLFHFGLDSGMFYVYAFPADSSAFCNYEDSLLIHVHNRPIIDSVIGENEVSSNLTYKYELFYSGKESELHWIPYNDEYSFNENGEKINIDWDQGEPYGFDVVAVSKVGSCPSDTFSFDVIPDFDYMILGPDTVCVSAIYNFFVNEDDRYSVEHSWSLNEESIGGDNSEVELEFLKPGRNSLSVEIKRGEREYNVSKNVFVEHSASQIAIQGPTLIGNRGGEVYSYAIDNEAGLELDIIVSDALSYEIAGDSLFITSMDNKAFSIRINSSVEGQCNIVPIFLNTTLASSLSENIEFRNGFLCPYSRATFALQLDEHVTNLEWNIPEGVQVVDQQGDSIVVEWGSNPGTYVLEVNYQRFGDISLSKTIELAPSPTPAFSENRICEGENAGLTTLEEFQSYYWTEEPDGKALSDSSSLNITSSGHYRVQVVDSNGCIGASTDYVRYIPSPVANISSSVSWESCINNATVEVSLSATEKSGYEYSWYHNNVLIEDQNGSVITFLQDRRSRRRDNFRVEIKDEICSESYERDLTVGDCGGGGTPCETSVSFLTTECNPFGVVNESDQEDGFRWDFGDKEISHDKHPWEHEYNAPGEYTIVLRNGCARSSRSVDVPFLAKFTTPGVVCQNMDTEFLDYSVNFPERTIDSWEWDFGDGNSVEGEGEDRSVVHAFEEPGEYVVSLTLTGKNKTDDECQHTFSDTVFVRAAPDTEFSIDYPACYANNYRFNNLSVRESDIIWIIGEDTVRNWSPERTFSNHGEDVIVNLQVTDFIGCVNEVSDTFNVQTPVPVEDIIHEEPLQICYGDSVLLEAPLSEEDYVWRRNGEIIDFDEREFYASLDGSYTVTFTQSECRMTTAPVEVSRFKFPGGEIEFDAPTCIGSEVVASVKGVQGNVTGYEWYLGDSLIQASSSHEFNIAELGIENAGLYSVIVHQSTTGCSFELPATELVVHDYPEKPVIESEFSEVCYGGDIEVEYANPLDNASWEWSVNDTKEAENHYALELSSVEANKTISLKVTDDETGCSIGSDNFELRVGANVTFSLSGDIEACERDYVNISSQLSSTDYDFEWYQDDFLRVGNSSRLDFASLSVADSGLYHAVAISNGNSNVSGCRFYSDSVRVSVLQAPEQPDIIGPLEFCAGGNVTLQSSIVDNIEWSTGSTGEFITVYSPGGYHVTVTDPTTGCEARNSVNVARNPLPDLRFVSPGVYERCASDAINFQGLNSYSYQWKLNGDDYGRMSSALYPYHSGNYTVRAWNSFGCEAESDTLRITSLPCACVVTTTEDGEGIGSLRDAIKCANENEGLDFVHFAIEEDREPGQPYVISIDSPLPVITEGVIIDGFSQTGDGIYDVVIQAGQHSQNALVQNASVSESQFRGLQFEGFRNAIQLSFINNGTLIEKNRFLDVSGEAVVIRGSRNIVRNNTFEGSGLAIRLTNATSGQVVNNTITGFDNGMFFNRSSNNNVRGNTFAGIGSNAVTIQNVSSGNSINNNIVTEAGQQAFEVINSDNTNFVSNIIGSDGDNYVGSIGNIGLHIVSSNNTLISENIVLGTGSDGIHTVRSSNVVVSDNSIGVNGDDTRGVGGHGIVGDSSISVSGNIVHSSALAGISLGNHSEALDNILVDNGSAGVYVDNDFVNISRNTITNIGDEARAIDLHGSANQNKPYAEFTGEDINERGITLTGVSAPGDSVEIFVSVNRPQQALEYVASAYAESDSSWSLYIPSGPYFDPESRNYYVNTASAENRTSELSDVYVTSCYSCVCEVVNANDSGEGSYRAAVDSAHAGVCRIISFEMSPEVINLESPVREIHVPLVVLGKEGIVLNGTGAGVGFDAWSQSTEVYDLGFSGWEAGIALRSDSSLVSGVEVNNSTLPVFVSGNFNTVLGSCINCDASGPIDNGIVIGGHGNVFGSADNPNTVENTSISGVMVDGGLDNRILYNTLISTGSGIVHENGGNHEYPAPRELLATLGEDGTATVSGLASAGDEVQLFLSDPEGLSAYTFIAETHTTTGSWVISIPSEHLIEKQNLYLVATATSADGSTSEFSDMVRLGDFPEVCVVSNTNNEGEGSLRAAVDCANDAGAIAGVSASIIFELPNEENEIAVEGSGFVVTNAYGVEIDPGQTPVKILAQDRQLIAFSWSTDNLSIRNLTFENFGYALAQTGGDVADISRNVFADNDTAYANVGGTGVSFVNNEIVSGNEGLYFYNGTAEVRNNQIVGLSGNGISGSGHIDIQGNHISGVGAFAVAVSDNMYLFNNTLHNNGQGGVSVSGDLVKISQNVISNEDASVKAIDLHGAGNSNKPAATFKNYNSRQSGVTVRGKSSPGDTVEVFLSSDMPQQALAYIDYAVADADSLWELDIPQGDYYDPDARNYYVNTATYNLRTSELSDVYALSCLNCVCKVVNADDDGAGSLRAAVDSAHAGECRTIAFDMDPAVIQLETPLRDIEVPVNILGEEGIDISGSEGTGFNVLADHVVISNLSLSGWDTGININSDESIIQQIRIDDVSEPVIIAGNDNQILGNCFGCESDEGETFDNAITVIGSGNVVGSEEYPNTIRNASNAGVLVDGGIHNSILYNVITGSESAIRHVNEGNEEYPAPYEMYATVREDEVAELTGHASAGDKIQVFLSDHTGKPVSEFVIETTAENNEWSLIIPEQYHPVTENVFFVVTSTSPDGSTSELSGPVRLGNHPMVCYVTNTENEGDGSLRAAVDCANLAGSGEGASARIVFDLSVGDNTIEVIGEGFVVNNNYGVVIDPEQIPVTIKGQDRLPYAFQWGSSNLTLRNLQFENFRTSLVSTGNHSIIQNSTFANIDTAVSFAGVGNVRFHRNEVYDVEAGVYATTGRAIVTENIFGADGQLPIKGFGVHLDRTYSALVSGNTFSYIGDGSSLVDADQIDRSLVISRGSHHTIRLNTFVPRDEAVVSPVLIADVENISIERNTVSGGSSGFEVLSSGKGVFRNNQFQQISGNGIELSGSEDFQFTGNTMTDMLEGSKPIHLHYGSTVESNNGHRVPEFEYATYHHGQLVVKGVANPHDIVEVFETNTGGLDMVQLLATVEADHLGRFMYRFDVSPHDINDRSFRATGTLNPLYQYGNADKYTSEASAAFNPNLKICFVTKNSDDDVEGTLRYNINKANRDECHLMLFDIPGDNPTIAPQSLLPEVEAMKLTIDATSQPGYSMNEPAVYVKGSESLSYGLKVNTEGNIAVHGLGFREFNEAVHLDVVRNFENSSSSYQSFGSEAVKFNADNCLSISLDSNIFVSETAPIGLKVLTPNVVLNSNIIRAGYDNAVFVNADTVAILGNDIYYENPSSNAWAIHFQNVDSTFAEENIIKGYPNGVKITDSKDSYILGNRFPADTSIVMEVGVLLENTQRVRAISSIIDTVEYGVQIKNSYKSEASGNRIARAVYRGITVSDGDSNIVSSNIVRMSDIGILLNNSSNVDLLSNHSYSHDSAGVIIDATSSGIRANRNRIGSSNLSNAMHSDGVGMIIYSSNNYIGETDTSGNIFSNNWKGGLVVSGGTGNKITYNTFFRNDSLIDPPTCYAIQHAENGNYLKSKPTFDTFERGSATGIFNVYGESEPGDTVHFYRSEGHYQDALHYVGKAHTGSDGKWHFVLDTTNADYFPRPFKNQTITLVATATDDGNNTSKLSDIFYVGHCYVTSNRDNADNEVPYPNSFRQAVVCANAQPEKAAISFAIDGSSGYNIDLSKEMLSFINTHGIEFNGGNILNNDEPIRVFKGVTESSSRATRFWHIDSTAGSSEFKNFIVQAFDTAVHVSTSAGVEMSKFTFRQISDIALSLEQDAGNMVFDNLIFEDSVKTVLMLPGRNHHVTLKKSEVRVANQGLVAYDSDTISVFDNTFEDCLVPAIINKAKGLDFAHNSVDFDYAHTGLQLQETDGRIRRNAFVGDSAQLVIEVKDSKNLQVMSNTFPGVVMSGVSFENVDSSAVSNNVFRHVAQNIAVFENCNQVNVRENRVGKIDSVGYDLRGSEGVFISKNIISAVEAEESLLIDLHRETGDVSNNDKEEPIILGYEVKRENDCDEERLSIYIYGTSDPEDYIELFFSDTLRPTFATFIDTAYADGSGNWQVRVPQDLYERDPEHVYSFTATASDSISNTSEAGVPYFFDNVEHRVVVKSTADTGSFTLREAVHDINCSNVFTRVYFEIDDDGPHEIALADSLPKIDAFLGFSMNGSVTQGAYNQEQEKADADSLIYITTLPEFGQKPVFVIINDTDSSEVANIIFKNVSTGLMVHNAANRLHNLTFTSTESFTGDTAIVVEKGSGNNIYRSTFEGFNYGVAVKEGEGNQIRRNLFREVETGVLVTKSSRDNRVVRNNFLAYDHSGVDLKGINSMNVIKENTFGSVGEPCYAPAVKFHNASAQYVGNNYMPKGRLEEGNEEMAFIMIGDSSHHNQISNNKIGVDPDGLSPNSSDLTGILVKPQTSGLTANNNVISGNQIAGLSVPGIKLYMAAGGSVHGNFLGIDSAFVQRQERQDYNTVRGMEGTAILIDSSEFVMVEGNTVVNFGEYALDIRNSDNIRMNTNRMFSQNSLLKAINLNLDNEMGSNDGIIAPVIDSSNVLDIDRIVIYGQSAYPNAQVQIYQGYSYADYDQDHTLRYIRNVTSDGDGNWRIELPSADFGFTQHNKYVAQVSVNSRSSELSSIHTIQPLLCQLTDNGINLLADRFDPCPGSEFSVDAVLDGLSYEWTSTTLEDTIRTRIAQFDTSGFVTLKISDTLGCEHIEEFDVVYKPRPIQPNFIVASRNFVGDTIVLVDVAHPAPDEYEWTLDEALFEVYQGETEGNLTGLDNMEYSAGREIRFIAPDEGTYEITQTSLRDGCQVSLSKEIEVEFKDLTDDDPYSVTPGVNKLLVYPSPISAGQTTNAFISTVSKGEVQVDLLSSDGMHVQPTITLSGETSYRVPLDIDGQSGGMYMVKVTTVSTVLTYKIVIL